MLSNRILTENIWNYSFSYAKNSGYLYSDSYLHTRLPGNASFSLQKGFGRKCHCVLKIWFYNSACRDDFPHTVDTYYSMIWERSANKDTFLLSKKEDYSLLGHHHGPMTGGQGEVIVSIQFLVGAYSGFPNTCLCFNHLFPLSTKSASRKIFTDLSDI